MNDPRVRNARIVLGAVAALFIGIALAVLGAPVELLGTVDVALPTATAKVEIYAWYVGLDLGIGVFLALCVARADWLNLGLTAAALMLGGLGVARLSGALLIDDVRWIHLAFGCAELATAALCAVTARRLRLERSPLWF